MDKIKEILSSEQRCSICHKRKAEYLCDMPTARVKLLHIKRENGVTDYANSFKWTTLTCDRKVCKECTVEVGADIHFCKRCIKKLKEIGV